MLKATTKRLGSSKKKERQQQQQQQQHASMPSRTVTNDATASSIFGDNDQKLNETSFSTNNNNITDSTTTATTAMMNHNDAGFIIDKKGRTRILVDGAGTGNTIKVKKFRIANAFDSKSVGALVCRIIPSIPVDRRSIGGMNHDQQQQPDDNNIGSKRNFMAGRNNNQQQQQQQQQSGKRVNECLLSLRVRGFDLSSTDGTVDDNGEEMYNSNHNDQNDQNQNNNNSSEDQQQNDFLNSSNNRRTNLPSYGRIKKNVMGKSRGKLRYVCLIRSTNRPMFRKRKGDISTVFIKGDTVPGEDEDEEDDDGYDDAMEDDDVNGYDMLFNPEDGDDNDDRTSATIGGGEGGSRKGGISSGSNNRGGSGNDTKNSNSLKQIGSAKLKGDVSPKDEISSFPVLVCLALYSDGTHPEVRKVLPLEKLVLVESSGGGSSDDRGGESSSGAGNALSVLARLAFSAGDSLEIDCNCDPSPIVTVVEEDVTIPTNAPVATTPDAVDHLRERFLWSLLQIHAILCTSVVERNMSGGRLVGASFRFPMQGGGGDDTNGMMSLPPMKIQNIDRGDLQYTSTVNGFLSENPVICALLERQRNWTSNEKAEDIGVTTNGIRKLPTTIEGQEGEAEEKASITNRTTEATDGLEMDDIAYDMIMGNYRSNSLFVDEGERKDAEDILNNIPWRVAKLDYQDEEIRKMQPISGSGSSSKPKSKYNKGWAGEGMENDAVETAGALSTFLRKRMRDLEAETCCRLIAWEDEKQRSDNNAKTGINENNVSPLLSSSSSAQRWRNLGNNTSNDGSGEENNATPGLADLFRTLEDLDQELGDMERWLLEKDAIIRPLTEDCRDIEEENRRLKQQWKSYDLLGVEIRRLLSGLVIPPDIEGILSDPSSQLSYDPNGNILVEDSLNAVEPIYNAGRVLKGAFDKIQSGHGVHLRSVNGRAEGLTSLAGSFCTCLAATIVKIMERVAVNISDGSDFKEAKGSHSNLAKKIRDKQRVFHSSMLDFIKLIEVLALLKPSILSAIREAYTDLVLEGILSKKKLKIYFASLPGKSTVNIIHVTNDLKDYSVSTLKSKSSFFLETGVLNMKLVQATDIEAVLHEMLPVIAREAYFTAALFGANSRNLSGREKKRNFEATKKNVDHCSQYFRYYMSRICGIASDVDAEGKKIHGDPMLSLVASIHLNEAMNGYIDRQKKGGDQSLSLAYVRATILGFRKKVDKQWVTWVEEQIKWVKTNPGVPQNGKRAGIFTSFARFPSYLDHMLTCCKAGRPDDYTPQLSRIKVVAYYLQKMTGALFFSLNDCAEKETTDQQYAANVMRMENSFFFTKSIKQRGPEMVDLFQKQITLASDICKQSTDAYLGWMIKREFKPLHVLFANISRVRRDVGDAEVSIHVPRSTFERTLLDDCNNDILKEKITALFERMEKHLSDAGGILPVAWKALVKVLYEWFSRWEKLAIQCYSITMEPSAVSVVRIAKAAGRVSFKRSSNERKDEMTKSSENIVSGHEASETSIINASKYAKESI